MPAHARRMKQSGAVARLPSSRLPLGTPQVPSRSQTTSRATNRSTSAASSHITTASDNASAQLEGDTIIQTSDSTQPVMSTAEAKLRRQNERIQLAEAALANPPPPERSRPQSRAKSKPFGVLKPSDGSVTSGRSRTTSISDGSVAVETRVNSYRSEGSLTQRSCTTSSQDGLTAPAVDAVPMERQDSVLDNNVGFQTYTNRRNSRRGDLGAYEDKPEVKQTTVEATVEQREILNVFANPLPGLDFLKGQAGWRNGQVQFIQHPNGDVSAHMWSPRSYQWDNIGQFSNIRKRIEGQLAGDHLKGETAWQKLQQNTLAYFRTIAKQREATTAGLDFGQAEIQQLLPDSSQAKQPTSSHKKLNATTPAFSQSGSQKAFDGTPAQQQPSVPQVAAPAEKRSFFAVPQGPRVPENHVQAPLSPRQARRADDPFTASAYGSAFPQLGSEYNGGTVAGPARQPISGTLPHSAYGSYNSTPLPAVPHLRMPYKPLPASRTSSNEDVGRSFGSQFYPRSSMPNIPSFIPGRVAGTGPEADRRHLSIASMDSLRGKPVTPLQAREAMRENLFKISNHAVERSLSREISRENLQSLGIAAAAEREQNQPPRRPVLNDPFQSNELDSGENYASPVTFLRSESEPNNPVSQIAARNMIYRNSGRSLHCVDLVPDSGTPSSSIRAHLTDIVPEVADTSYPTPARRIQSTSYDFNADPQTSCSMRSYTTQPSMNLEQQLSNWWTSGSKFARQEDFYHSIKALSEPNSTIATSAGQTSTVANPRRPTVTRSTTFTAGDILTRVLVPVYENLSSYVEGPPDYWSNWTRAHEWCIDRSPNGNNSFYESVQKPSALGQRARQQAMEGRLRFAGVPVPPGLERRLGYNQY